jgi:uncharacterized protein YcaQ
VAVVRLTNRELRRALLSLNGLAGGAPGAALPGASAPAGPEWARGMVARLGFVQVDPIVAVERAHHTILFSRNRRYRKDDLTCCLERDRTLFENWTHDAAILPTESWPYWKHYCARSARFEPQPSYRRYFSLVTPKDTQRILRRIVKDGPLRPRDCDAAKVQAKWLDDSFPKPTVAKIAMELLWRSGKLAVTRRERNEKVYDLAERVLPERVLKKTVSKRAYVDWACREALKRLGVGTAAQIARFFDAVTTDEAAAWCSRGSGKDLVEARVELADGSESGSFFGLVEVLETLPRAAAPPRGLRLISPFDPLIHDRRRTERVFGFDYAIEIWVPPKKRKYGYYVLPVLEGGRFIGRVDSKADRKKGVLNVLGVWWEPGVRPTRTRQEQLEKRLLALGRFTGAPKLEFAKGYDRR